MGNKRSGPGRGASVDEVEADATKDTVVIGHRQKGGDDGAWTVPQVDESDRTEPSGAQERVAKGSRIGLESPDTDLGEPTETASREVLGVLACIDGPLKGRALCVFEGDTLLGRNAPREPLDSKSISGRHAWLRADESYFVLEPVNPERNRTTVDGHEVRERERVEPGARIRLGKKAPSTFVLLGVS